MRYLINAIKNIFEFKIEYLEGLLLGFLHYLILSQIWNLFGYKTSSYFFVMFAVSLVSVNTFFLRFIDNEIRRGSIILKLYQPISYDFAHFQSAISGTILNLPVSLCILLFLNVPIKEIVIFLIEVPILTVLTFYFFFSIGVLFFKIESSWSVTWILENVIFILLSGRSIPIDLIEKNFPIIKYLPFKWFGGGIYQVMKNFKVEIILIQLFWAFVFYLIAKFLWKISIKRLMIYGG